ncbi:MULTISPECIES: hypothetical protein [unclassified Streptomyces]|uniref:Rv1733c family protein n=1 Tax=unclassified Streptomyces TaxID=2593676 RepID=UPI0019039C13|nr:hypothetical protein [Streptomyces sp. HSG2]
MGASHPSHPTGPRPPGGSGGPNPLRRGCDRFEDWFRRALYVLFVVGLPVAAITAGQASYDSSMSTVRSQSAEREAVTARVTERVPGDSRGAEYPAEVRWTDDRGEIRTATAMVQSGTAKGAEERVWVDREGAVTGPPMSAAEARTAGWFTGGLTALAVAVTASGLRAGVRVAVDRRRYARWASEWDRVEPLWSARFTR